MERKLDIREKIQLGGLIVKAGLRDEDKDILLGGLIELSQVLKNSKERTRLAALGNTEFQFDAEKSL